MAFAAAILAWSGTSEAASAPSTASRVDDRPWGQGTIVPTFGLGASGFFSDIANVSFGLGFSYYIINGLSVGLGLSDTILIYRSAFKARYPGVEDALPTNIFDITPRLQYVFFRSRRFSPYVYAGAGPVFFNHGAGTHGQWGAGPGVFFNVGGPLFVNVSVAFSGMFPAGRCNDALTYQSGDQSVVLDVCSFRWSPQIGAVLAFGGGGRRARQRRRESPPRAQPAPYVPPADNPMQEATDGGPDGASSAEGPTGVTASGEDAPMNVAPPSGEEAPTDVAPPSGEGASTDVTSPPGEGAPTDVAPPPVEGAPTDVVPPPGEGAPTDVVSPPGEGA